MNEGRRQKDSYPAPFFYLLLPLLVAVPTAILAWRHGFDGLYGQDAYAYYDYAVNTLRQNLLMLEAPAPFFWPPGYPLLVALLTLILGPAPIAAQLVSLVAGALLPILTAYLAFELWAPVPASSAAQHGHDRRRQAGWIALLAGLLTALTPQLWQSSAVSMADTTALASATLGAWGLARYGRERRGVLLALGAAATAFALLTRMAYTPVAVTGAVYALFILARQPRRTALAHAGLSIVVVTIILWPVLHSLLQGLQHDGRQAFLGQLGPSLWQARHVLQNEFVTANGRQQYRLVNGLYYALTPAHNYFFTPLLAPLLLPGLWRLWRERSLSRILLLGIWPLGAYLLLVGYPAQNFRFTLIFLPPLAIILASGIVSVGARLRARYRPLLFVILAGALLWMACGGWSLTGQFMARKEANLATVRWAQQQVDPQARLFTFAITLTLEQYTDLQVYDLYNLTQAEMGDLLQNGGSRYLLLDVQNIEQQWSERAPGQNYRWLAQTYGLRRLGRHRQYSLFRIGNGA